MAEGSVDRSEVKRYTARSRQLDDRLTWISVPGLNSPTHIPRRPSLEQKLIDFNARYERACLED